MFCSISSLIASLTSDAAIGGNCKTRMKECSSGKEQTTKRVVSLPCAGLRKAAINMSAAARSFLISPSVINPLGKSPKPNAASLADPPRIFSWMNLKDSSEISKPNAPGSTSYKFFDNNLNIYYCISFHSEILHPQDGPDEKRVS